MAPAPQCACGKRLVKNYVLIGKCASCSKAPTEISSAQPSIPNGEQVDTLQAIREELQKAKDRGYSRLSIAELLDDIYGIPVLEKASVIQKVKTKHTKSNKFSRDIKPVKHISNTNPLVDIRFSGFEAVCYSSKQIKQVSSIKVKQYGIIPIPEHNKRAVIKVNNVQSEFVELVRYKPADGYMNISEKCYRPGILSSAMIQKVIIDNDLNFKYGDLDLVFYDIETYNINAWNKVPDVDDANAKIGLISLVHIKHTHTGLVVNVEIFYLNRHYINQDIVNEQLSACNINSIEYKQCAEEHDMSYEFFKTLGHLESITLVAGFNSSSSQNKNNKFPGYDLGFLIKRCSAKLTTHTQKVKFGVRWGNQFTTIDEIPRAYFIDMQVLLHNGLMPTQRNAMESFKLDEYLRLFQVPQKHKIGSYRQMQEQLATGADISIIAAYCVYDSYALHLVNQKSMAIDRLLNLGEMLNVPLSHILYNTQASNLGFQLMRQYVKQGFCISYKPICEKIPYQGAFTYLNDDEKLKINKNVASFDFTSLYPSIIRINNLSPDTLLPDDYEGTDCHVVTVSDTYINNGKPMTYKFSRTVGVIPSYLAQLFELRLDYKKKYQEALERGDNLKAAQYDVLQYNTKICLNTLYGLLSSNFPLIQPEVGICCTATGRAAIQKTLEIYTQMTGRSPIMCDTDSIYGTFDNLEQITKFPALVRDALEDSLYNLEYEGTNELFMMSKAKKSYVKLHNGHLTIKGLAWSKYTTEAREWVKKMFHDILIIGDINKVLHQFYHYHRNRLVKIIENKSVADMRDYTRIVKLSGKSNEVKYLHKNYPFKEDIAYVVEILPTRKNQPKAELIRPINDPELNFETINIQAIMQWLMSGATKLIMPMKLGPIETDDSDLVHYRTEVLKGTYVDDCRDQKPLSIDEYCQFLRDIKDQNMTVHEVFKGGRKYRVFIDVDYTNKSELNQVISYMKGLLADRIEGGSKNSIKDVITSNQDKSFHVIFNVRGTLLQIKSLAEKCKRAYSSVDTAIYAINKSLRSPLCAKIDRATKTINKASVHTPPKAADLEACIIHNITNTYDLIERIQDETNPIIHTKAIQQGQEIPQTAIPIINEILAGVGITYDKFRLKDNILSVTPINPFYCKGCGIKHSAHNPYVIYNPNKIIVKCSASNIVVETPLQKLSTIEYLQSLINSHKHIPHDYRATNTVYFESDLPAATLVTINSSVGTGKSVWLKAQLAKLPSEYKIVCLSFRRSFTRTFCESYGLESYLDISGKISLDAHPKIMIQCDSLQRLELGPKIDLLILDEVVSILSQFNSSMIKNAENIYQIMHCLLNDARQIIAMDALLYPEISDTLSKLCGCQYDVEYIENLYKPYAADIPFKIGARKDIIKAIYHRIKSMSINAKVAAFVSSYSAIKTIHMNLVKDGRKVLMLHGKDLVFDQCLPNNSNKLVSMKELKVYWFEHLHEIFDNYDVLLYTSTITAGLSIDKPEIDAMFGCYVANTCSPLDFVQGMFRVRKRKCTEIFYQHGNQTHSYNELIPAEKASKLTQCGLDISGKQELQIVSECLSTQLKHERDALTIKFLTEAIGFRLQLENISEQEFEPIEIFEVLQFRELYETRYIPSESDLQIYEKIQKSGGEYVELELLDDKSYYKGLWISILKTYNMIKTPKIIFKLTLDDIFKLFEHRQKYANMQYRMEKYDLIDGTDYNAEKYNEVTDSIVYTLNKLNGDQMLIRVEPHLQRHLKDKQTQELLNIIATKFNETKSIPKPDLQQFLNSLDRKFEVSGKYAIRAANKLIMNHGYNIKTTNKSGRNAVRVYELSTIITNVPTKTG